MGNRVKVRRYRNGQLDVTHGDAYPPPDPGKLEEYFATGGQRLYQCLCYLNDVPVEDGGCTAFHHPALGGLEVQPRKGSCLIFFPAFADGSPDDRMSHSGERYVGKESKWIANCWIHEKAMKQTPKNW